MSVASVSILLFSLSGIMAESHLQLASHTSPANDGSTQRQIQCIMQQLQQPYKVLTMPWRRARQEVKQNRIDGYFAALPTPEMEPSAVLTAPLFLENWYWFWRPGKPVPDLQQKLRYGVILGSHQALWLKEQGIKPELEVNDTAQLVQLLNIGRIDSFIADLDDANTAMQQLKLAANTFQQRFLRYVPLGVYFSYERLLQRPGFMQQFNEAIPLCASRPFALSASEQQLLHDKWFEAVTALAADPQLTAAVAEQNARALTLDEIIARDQNWQIPQPFADQQADFTQSLLNSAPSRYLAQWQAQQQSQITEVLLLDHRGANVAISKTTSDYWQGDETPFLGMYQQPQQYFFDVVEYDSSTQRFQVKLSVPVRAKDGRHIGVLTVGIDVERALSQSD